MKENIKRAVEEKWEDDFFKMFVIAKRVNNAVEFRLVSNPPTMKAFIRKQLEAQKAEHRKEMIAELEKIEAERWDKENHCTCLAYAIFKMKCNCDNECGNCRLQDN